MKRRPIDPGLSLLAAHSADPAAFPGLLESVASGTALARWDILFAMPDETLRLHAGVLSGTAPADHQASFLGALDGWLAAEQVERRDTDIPFVGGWLLLLGYELAHEVETRVPYRPFGDHAPDALAVRCRAGVIRDRETGQTCLVAEDSVSEQALTALATRLQQAASTTTACGSVPAPAVVDVDPAAQLRQAMARIHEYILDGDVFQVNLSREWRAQFDAAPDPTAVYRALKQHNPSPFAGSLNVGGLAVLSSSPERLIRVDGRCVETRPIAGTRRRGRDDDADRALSRELMAHPKERAEHVMLIDLERNDLGRVCQPGSVEVDEMMQLESYAHVHHIVSNVRGRLRPGVGPGAAVAAVFPGGTITGCPKVRCMQIIAELEQSARGPYTGAMGYLGVDGRMDLNILIRTVVLQGQRAWVRAGAGIVADSDPDAEIREMQAKARGLLPAIGIGADHG